MERITLNMVPTGVLEICHASQYDIGREIRFDLINGTDDFVLSGNEDITIFIRDFDGNLIESSAPNTSSNYVVWTSSEGELDVSGPAICELRVTKDDDVLGSANFIMEIEADPYDGAGVHVETIGPADICTFETTLPEPLQSVIVNVEATGGNGTPDNPNPINGYSSANITRCGVNLFNCDSKLSATAAQVIYTSDENYIYMNGTKNGGTYAPFTSALYFLKKGTYYAKAFFISGTATNDPQLSFILPDGSATGNIVNGATFTLSEDGNVYPRFAVWSDSTVFTNLKIGIVISTASISEYSEYNGQTYTIAFGQTVYGGVLDVTRGKASVNYARAKIRDLNWYYSSALSCFNTTDLASVVKGGNVGLMCECESPLSVPLTTANINANDNFVRFNKSASGEAETGNFAVGALVIKDTDYSDVASMLSALGDYYIRYELATPFDIDLTPKVISAIVGTNNVFADCGETEVKYLVEG